MSFYLLSDSEESWQPTLVCPTMFEKYSVFIQQYKDFSHENWVTSDRFDIPKSIIEFVATLPGKTFTGLWKCYNFWWTSASTKIALL